MDYIVNIFLSQFIWYRFCSIELHIISTI